PAVAPQVVPMVQGADLDALAGFIQACQQCARHEQRLRAVPGAGRTERPYYLIVAEQPGIDDEVAGQPFQGDSGRLLAAMLTAARLPNADERYGTYVMKCRAPGGHEPDPAEIAACRPYLHREIDLLRPRWILALGRVAAQAVLGGSADLEALRGASHPYQPANGPAIPVWVTHQPASLLVRSALKAEAWRDLVGLAQAVRAAAEKSDA
ncbi:MAG: uracil-DNA glycosylase, partial [Castellaniella sp.]|uniref:uracil-DNA glycosylase n=1 Tax=Castellaniella sp. TaxID=1955812 RepID=UPI003C77BE28